jgi:hypothetical protein
VAALESSLRTIGVDKRLDEIKCGINETNQKIDGGSRK